MSRERGASLSRSLPKAQDAFEEGNAERSRMAHAAGPSIIQEQGHASYAYRFDLRLLLKIMAETGFRSALISVGFIACAAFMDTSVSSIDLLRFGILLLVCSGFINALVTYSAKSTEVNMYRHERSREEWECANYLEGEVKEMVELYLSKSKNLSRSDAFDVMNKLSTDTKLFVDIMMVEELGLLDPLATDLNPLPKAGLVFAAWVVGATPSLLALFYLRDEAALDPYSPAFIFPVVMAAFVMHSIREAQKLLRLTIRRGLDMHSEVLMLVGGVLASAYLFVLGLASLEIL